MPPVTEYLLHYLRSLTSFPSTHPADSVLLHRFVHDRDEDAFATLVSRHGPMVLGVCQRVLRDLHTAEDAFQATFLVLARKAPALRPRTSLAAWLHGVARHVAQKALRADVRRKRREGQWEPEATPSLANPLDELSARELLLLLDEELERLPEVYRQPILLCCLQGLTQEEAAQLLGWTAGSVKGRLERGRERLRSRLQRRGFGLGAVLGAVEVARAAGDPLRAGSKATLARTGLRFATHRGTGEMPLGSAVSLAEGVLKGMAWSKGTVLAGLLLTALAFASAGVLASQMLAGRDTSGQPETPRRPDPAPPRRVDLQGDALPPRAIARLGTLRFRGVRGCLAFSPDGKWLASATGPAGERVTLWDPEGHEVLQIAGKATLTQIAFSPDGKLLACSTNSSSCRVIEAATGKERCTVTGFHGLFTRDGKLITADRFGTPARVDVWDSDTGRSLRHWSCTGGVERLTTAGQTLALIENAHPDRVQFHDLRTGAKLHSLQLPDGRSYLALSSDGKTLATASRTHIRLWDVASKKEIRSWAGRADSPPVFSPANKRLAWTGYDERAGIARLWVAQRDSAVPREVGTPVNNFERPCFSPDGKSLAVVTDGGVVEIRKLDADTEGKPLGHTTPVLNLALTADGRHVISRARTGLFAWEARTGKLLRHALDLPATEQIRTLLPDGRLLTEDRDKRLFRVRAGITAREVFRIPGRPDAGAQAIAPGGRYTALTGLKGEICIVDLSTGQCRYRFDPQGGAFGLRLSADGNLCVWYRRSAKGYQVHVRRHPGETRVMCTLTNTAMVKRWLDNRSYVSPDGRWLIVPTEEGRLQRWDLNTGQGLTPLRGGQRTAWNLTWSPDGQLLAVSGSATAPHVIDPEAPREVRVWDVPSGKRLPYLDLPQVPACVLFSPDQRTMVTTDWHGIIHLREVATGKERDQLKGHLPGEVSALALSADGRVLVSGGYDSQVLVWDLTTRMPDGRWRQIEQQPAELRAAWHSLANADARVAYHALWQLVSDPGGSTALLKEQLHPIRTADPARVAQLLQALDADEFAQRQRAHRELEVLGEAVATPLRQVLARKVSAEARKHLQKLLARLEGVPTGQRLQALRGVEVLEHIGTPDARALLKTLANGAPGARLTREAKEALARSR
jgi:RNA polymerase sigma factor (sigma-70 family)